MDERESGVEVDRSQSAAVVASAVDDVVLVGSHSGDGLMPRHSLRSFVFFGVLIVIAFVAVALVATSGSDEGQANGSVVDGVCSGGHSPVVFAVDAGSGAPRWQFCSTEAAFAQTIAATADSVFVAVGSPSTGSAELVALDATRGREQWRRGGMRFTLGAGPFVAQGVIVALVGQGADRQVVALDARTGSERWTVAALDFEPIAVTDQMVVVVTRATIAGPVAGPPQSTLRGLDRRTGVERWKTALFYQDNAGVVGPRPPTAVAGSTVVVPTGTPMQAQSAAIDANTGKELWRGVAVDNPSHTGDGVIVGRAHESRGSPVSEVVALDSTTGATLWTAPGEPSYGELWVGGGGALFLQRRGPEGGVVALELDDGTERWIFTASATLYGEPLATTKDSLLLGWERVFGAVSISDGSTKWTFAPPLVGPSWGTGLVTNGRTAFISVSNFPPTD
jgi:outer membrane protein assembly factor BamB